MLQCTCCSNAAPRIAELSTPSHAIGECCSCRRFGLTRAFDLKSIQTEAQPRKHARSGAVTIVWRMFADYRDLYPCRYVQNLHPSQCPLSEVAPVWRRQRLTSLYRQTTLCRSRSRESTAQFASTDDHQAHSFVSQEELVSAAEEAKGHHESARERQYHCPACGCVAYRLVGRLSEASSLRAAPCVPLLLTVSLLAASLEQTLAKVLP